MTPAAFDISSSDRATLLAGVSFDASGWELWPYLCRGASLDIPPDELRSSPEGLRDWIARQELEKIAMLLEETDDLDESVQ